MLHLLLKIFGVIAIALSLFALPLSVLAGNPAVLGIGFGGLLAGAILMGLARIIDLLEQLVDRKGLPR